MKIETLKIGTKFGTELVQFEVNIRISESVTDMAELSKGSADFVNQMFNRGWRIWNQEQSGARDAIKVSTIAERKDAAAFTAKLQNIVDTADPTAPAQRTGRPARQPEVTLDAAAAQQAMQSGNIEALTAMLAAQGIKVNIA